MDTGEGEEKAFTVALMVRKPNHAQQGIWVPFLLQRILVPEACVFSAYIC
jgi:hypothetical protein